MCVSPSLPQVAVPILIASQAGRTDRPTDGQTNTEAFSGLELTKTQLTMYNTENIIFIAHAIVYTAKYGA